MKNETCKNCGGDKGIHKYDTGQCPINGHEAPIGKPDVWTFTTYEPEDDSAALEAAAAELAKVADGMLFIFDRDLPAGTVGRTACDMLIAALAHWKEITK